MEQNSLASTAFILVILAVMSIKMNAAVNVYLNTCQDFQAMQTGNSSVVYLLNQSIDCSRTTFTVINGSFSGTLDGQNFCISNIFINESSTSNVAIFSTGTSAVVTNLLLMNFTVSGSSMVGVLFGTCTSCSISNVTLNNTGSYTNSIVGYGKVGGLVGQANSCVFSNCIVANTYVSCSFQYAGGLVGLACTMNMTRCYNLGPLTNSSQVIINAAYNGGGLAGDCYTCRITSSGVHRGHSSQRICHDFFH